MDTTLRVVSADTAFVDVLGGRPTDLRGTEFCDLFHPTARGRVWTQLTRLLAGAARFRERGVLITGHRCFRAELLGTAVGRDTPRGTSIVAVIQPDPPGLPDEAEGIPRAVPELSAVDARLLEGIAAGSTTDELAATLYLSRSGVEYRLTGMLRRMGVANRPALVAKAYSLGLFAVGTWPPRVPAGVER